MTQKVPKEIAEDSLIPIIVGITGHRYNFSDKELLVIKKVFTDLHDKYKNTPIVVLSPLAEGADRLIATAALSLRSEMPISVICPLPLPREEYKNDFDENSKNEFELLLKETGDGWFDIPLVEGNTKENIVKDYTDETTGEKEGPRNKQYEAVGIYVAQHSHILLALWDGVDKPESIGGTSQIVKMRHEGTLKCRNPLDEVDSGPVYYFKTTKNGSDDAEIEPYRDLFPGRDLYCEVHSEDLPENPRKKAFERSLERLEIFNGDVKYANRKFSSKIAQNREYVIPAENLGLIRPFPRRILEHYVVADTLAGRYRLLSDWTMRVLFVLALLALICFELYAHLITSPFMLAGYPILLSIGFLVYFLAKSHKIQNKYLDYRALAEGLRVQFFWHLFGVPDEVVDLYLRKQKSELDWIKHAVRSVNTPFSNDEFVEKRRVTEKLSLTTGLEVLVLARWVLNQAEFFNRKAGENNIKKGRYHKGVWAFFLFGLILSIIMVAVDHYLHDETHFPVLSEMKLHHILIVLMGIAPATAAALGGYLEKMAIPAQASRYSWMGEIFTRAHKELKNELNNGNFAAARKIVADLGQEALEENADWLILRRERKLEVPKG